MVSQLRSRLAPALRWLAPSAAAACGGALAAGLTEGCALGRSNGVISVIATTGFVAVLALPVLLAASALVRGLIWAWRPAELSAGLVDADGAAPRLAGWLAVIGLGAAGLGAAMFQSVWLLAQLTAFKPLTTSFVEPAVAIATALAILAASRPCARLFAALARRLDARWRRAGHSTLLRPTRLLVSAAVAANRSRLHTVAARHRAAPRAAGPHAARGADRCDRRDRRRARCAAPARPSAPVRHLRPRRRMRYPRSPPPGSLSSRCPR